MCVYALCHHRWTDFTDKFQADGFCDKKELMNILRSIHVKNLDRKFCKDVLSRVFVCYRIMSKK